MRLLAAVKCRKSRKMARDEVAFRIIYQTQRYGTGAPTYTSVFFFIERFTNVSYLELSNFKTDACRKRFCR